MPTQLKSVCFHYDGHTVSVGGTNGAVYSVDLRAKSKKYQMFKGHTNADDGSQSVVNGIDVIKSDGSPEKAEKESTFG